MRRVEAAAAPRRWPPRHRGSRSRRRDSRSARRVRSRPPSPPRGWHKARRRRSSAARTAGPRRPAHAVSLARTAVHRHGDVVRPVVAVSQECLSLGLRQGRSGVVPVGLRRVEAGRRGGVRPVHVHDVGAAHDHVGRVGQVEPRDLQAGFARDTCWPWPTGCPSRPWHLLRCRPSSCPPWRSSSTRAPRADSSRSGPARRPALRSQAGHGGAPPQDLAGGRAPLRPGGDHRRHHGRRQHDRRSAPYWDRCPSR